MQLWIGPTDIFRRDSLIKFGAGGVVNLLCWCRFRVVLNEAKLEMQSTFLTCPRNGHCCDSSIVYEEGLRWEFRVHIFLKLYLAFVIQELRIADLQI